MVYLLDTNVLVHYVRQNATKQLLEEQFDPFSTENITLLSVISVGEIYVFAENNNWGATKYNLLQQLIDACTLIPIDNQRIIEAYLDVQLFSRNNHPELANPAGAISMGQNDAWIAATAISSKACLITSDQDFQHLKDLLVDLRIYGQH